MGLCTDKNHWKKRYEGYSQKGELNSLILFIKCRCGWRKNLNVISLGVQRMVCDALWEAGSGEKDKKMEKKSRLH